MAESVLNSGVVALSERVVHELTADPVVGPHRHGQPKLEEPLEDFIHRLVGNLGFDDGEIIHRVGCGRLLYHVAFNALGPWLSIRF